MIKDMFENKKSISFEVFPPKKDGEFDAAFEVLDKMALLQPDFISVTYGAGGSRSGKTMEIASYIQNKLKIDAVAHMTCVGNKKEQLLQVAAGLKEKNVNHILALRGDRPKDMSDEQFESRDFAHANDMMSFLKERTDLHMAGACYPEKHFESFSMESDLNHLKRKQDAGAEFFISQLFFDNDFYYSFLEKAAKKGITIPICAGIMPITTAKQIGTTVTLSGSTIPKVLADIFATYGDNPEEMRKAGIDFAIRQIRDLQENGVNDIHIYTMNKPKMAAEIMEAIYR
ncbi:MAG: methylenetetrahydrofolate reductase [NAD(P)H] [Eubacterium sp.]|nr:methylenetetrahydrofolate reductase [NAD(P)H] [Eubacterium sp.]MCM1214388.1 methylenetetrahydrofolate reductase [NAD(P)H] [Lachnospiraceae bacterium]MCM1304470.1 methylenetetrahydrofolate reductase [NAD(P)H] [Butyrivibrio sp.]MCM1342588.1 methylenetetrahydrofolate reductase [NAD(P)H] [Muribaculaceae bacterium]MCM1238679.1 methylenetetrahydrofolate reductase [NAD(P)H] [Lachnospiraceae bacterium]